MSTYITSSQISAVNVHNVFRKSILFIVLLKYSDTFKIFPRERQFNVILYDIFLMIFTKCTWQYRRYMAEILPIRRKPLSNQSVIHGNIQCLLTSCLVCTKNLFRISFPTLRKGVFTFPES